MQTPTQTAIHPQFGQVTYTIREVPDDPESQVQATIAMMRDNAIHGAATPIIRQQAADIAAECGPDQLAQVEAAWLTVKSRLTFQEDSQTAGQFARHDSPIVEALLLPEDVAAGHLTHGDCDDFSVYAASLLTALRIPCSFVTIAAEPIAPSQFTHVYVAVTVNGQRIAVDCSHGEYCGWESPTILRIQEWPVGGGSSTTWAVIAALTAAGYYLYKRKAA